MGYEQHALARRCKRGQSPFARIWLFFRFLKHAFEFCPILSATFWPLSSFSESVTPIVADRPEQVQISAIVWAKTTFVRVSPPRNPNKRRLGRMLCPVFPFVRVLGPVAGSPGVPKAEQTAFSGISAPTFPLVRVSRGPKPNKRRFAGFPPCFSVCSGFGRQAPAALRQRRREARGREACGTKSGPG